MANPWDNDPIASSNEAAAPWEQDEIVTPKKKRSLEGKTAKDFLPTESDVNSYLEKIRGVGETGANLVSGALGGMFGGTAGTIAGIMEHGIGTEKQRKATEEAAGHGMEAFTYQPRTEAGKQYTENAGKLIEQAIPLLGHIPYLEGALGAVGAGAKLKQAGRPIKEVPPPKGYAPEVPLALDEALKQVENAPENQVAGPRRPTTLPWEADPIVQPAGRNARQMELDFGVEQPNAFDKNGKPILSAGTTTQARPETVTVSPQGTALVSPEQVAGYEQYGRRMETPEAPPQAPLQGQGDLFLNEQVEGPVASPYNAAERGVLPSEQTANPALARRQMELQLEQQAPMYGTPEGPVLPQGAPEPYFTDRALRAEQEAAQRAMSPEATQPTMVERARTITEDPEQVAFYQREAEAKAREAQAKAAVESGETGNLFADYVNKHRDYELFRDENGRPLSRDEFNKTVDNLAKDPQTGYIRPEDMDAAYKKYLENFNGVQAGLFDQPTTALEMSATLKADATTRLVDRHPLVAAAERFLNQEQQFLDQLKQQGASLAAIKDATRDVTLATERLTKTKENVTKGLKGGPAARPLRKGGLRGKQQGGSVTTDFLTSVLSLGLDKKFGKTALEKTKVEIVPGEKKFPFVPVKKGLEDYTKERRSAEAIKADIVKNNTPDIKSTPISDTVQAGGLYKSLETNNPIVRKTFAAVSDADHAAATNIKAAIADPKSGLPALFRRLTKKDAGDWWSARQIAEGEMNLSPQQMKQMGMNDKQIAMNTRFNEVMDFVFNKLNEARALAGKAPVDKRIGYLASQASGDFRRMVYSIDADGTKKPIGLITSDNRMVLNRRVEKLKQANPSWEVGEETTAKRGRRENRQKAFEDAVEMLAENNPDTKALVDAYHEILRKDAYDYMNAKKHTQQKKGVFGMEGFKRDVDAWTNAKEGMASQIRYVEKILKWAEMSKAVHEVKPLLTDQSINMPNAKKWSSDYIDRALGIQTSKVGAAIDDLTAAVGEKFGVGPSAVERGVGTVKGAVSKYLLGFLNPFFLALNMVQPLVASPAMNSLLAGRGINLKAGTLSRGAMDFLQMKMAERYPERFKLDKLQQETYKEGVARNIFGSEIFEHTAHLRKGSQFVSKLAEIGIPQVEGATRGTVFTAYVKALHENGITGTKLYDIAENLTNQVMTDYRNIEAPSMYKGLGAIGDTAVTLQRYKHNTLSNLAMLAREGKRTKNFKPIGVALGVSLATSGLTGMLGFNEADQAYQLWTKHITGKPDTLTRLLLDNVGDTLSYGAVSTLTGIDLSKRFGMTLLPDSPGGALFPGVSRLAEPVVSGAKALLNPTDTTQWQRFARDVVPNAARGLVERKFFENENGLAINPKDLGGTVQRTETDKMAKNFGATGLEESKAKTRLYQESLVDKAISDKRQGVTNKILDDLYQIDPHDTAAMKKYFHEGKGAQYKQDFLDAEGNIDNLVAAVEKFRMGGVTTAMQRKMLSVAAAQKEGDALRAKRYVEMKK